MKTVCWIITIWTACVVCFIAGNVTKKPIQLPDTREVGIRVAVWGKDGKDDWWSDIMKVDSRRKITFSNAHEVDIFFSEITEDFGELEEANADFIYAPDLLISVPDYHKLEFKALAAKKKRFSQWVICGWVQDPEPNEPYVKSENVLPRLPEGFDVNNLEECFIYILNSNVGLK